MNDGAFMEIRFKNNKLRKCYESGKVAEKAFGAQVGRRYVGRINIMKSATDVEELETLPGLRCHALTRDRKGQYAINLTGYYRLIFTVEDEALTIARIVEVSKHYGH